MDPKHINWVPRKVGLQPMVLESQVQTLGKPSIFTTTPANITSSQKSTRSEPLQYTIQVGAYKTEANASQMAGNLFKKGYRTRITPDTKNGAPLFKVHVDKFSSKKQALKLTEKFATEENLPSFVTTTSLN